MFACKTAPRPANAKDAHTAMAGTLCPQRSTHRGAIGVVFLLQMSCQGGGAEQRGVEQELAAKRSCVPGRTRWRRVARMVCV